MEVFHTFFYNTDLDLTKLLSTFEYNKKINNSCFSCFFIIYAAPVLNFTETFMLYWSFGQSRGCFVSEYSLWVFS